MLRKPLANCTLGKQECLYLQLPCSGTAQQTKAIAKYFFCGHF